MRNEPAIEVQTVNAAVQRFRGLVVADLRGELGQRRRRDVRWVAQDRRKPAKIVVVVTEVLQYVLSITMDAIRDAVNSRVSPGGPNGELATVHGHGQNVRETTRQRNGDNPAPATEIEDVRWLAGCTAA